MSSKRSGFTLVETIVWILTLSAVAGLLVCALISGGEGGRGVTSSAYAGSVSMNVLKRLGADVRKSSGIVIESGPYQSGKDTVILEEPGEGRVIYTRPMDCLYRISTVDGEERRVPMGRVESLTFSYAPGGPWGSPWVSVEVGGKKTPTLSARFRLMNPTVSGGRAGGDR